MIKELLISICAKPVYPDAAITQEVVIDLDIAQEPNDCRSRCDNADVLLRDIPTIQFRIHCLYGGTKKVDLGFVDFAWFTKEI
jgi:hypothetical protein